MSDYKKSPTKLIGLKKSISTINDSQLRDSLKISNSPNKKRISNASNTSF